MPNMIRPHSLYRILLVSACALPVSCMAQPRDGQKLARKNAFFAFQGWTDVPGEGVRLEIRDQATGKWSTVTSLKTVTSADTDFAGNKWYSFNAPSVALPTDADLWASASSVNGQRRIRADLRAASDIAITLHSFSVGADDCINSVLNTTGSGYEVMAKCASSNTPKAELFVNCGGTGQPCCRARNVSAANECPAQHFCRSSNEVCVKNRFNWDSISTFSNADLLKVSGIMAELARRAYDFGSIDGIGFTRRKTIEGSVPVRPPGQKTFELGIAEPKAFVAEGTNDNVLIVSIKGTNPSNLGDWAIDLASMQDSADGTVYHAGFLAYANTMWNSVRKAIGASCGSGATKPVWFTGHSLGGAAAQIMAFRAQRAGCRVGGVMTFGSPKPGPTRFRSDYKSIGNSGLHDRTHRWVHDKDPVPCTPFGSLWAHGGRHIHRIDASGNLHLFAAEGCASSDSLFNDIASGLADFSGGAILGDATSWLDHKLDELGLCPGDPINSWECWVTGFALPHCFTAPICTTIQAANEALAFEDNVNRLLPHVATVITGSASTKAHKSESYRAALQ